MFKKVFLLIAVLFSGSILLAESNTTPEQYLTQIVKAQDIVVDKMFELSLIVDKRNAEEMNASLKILQNTCDESIKMLKSLETIENDLGLKKSGLEMLKYYKSASVNDFPKMVALLSKKMFDDEDKEEFQKIGKEMKFNEFNWNKNFINAQEKFIEFHKIVIPPQKVGIKTLDGLILANAIEYNNYFADLQAAIIEKIMGLSLLYETGDIDALSKNQKELTALINSSLEKVNALPPFEGDNSLIEASTRIFNFYQETNNKVFSDILKIISKKPEDRTAEDSQNLMQIISSVEKNDRLEGNLFSKAQSDFVKKFKIDLNDDSEDDDDSEDE